MCVCVFHRETWTVKEKESPEVVGQDELGCSRCWWWGRRIHEDPAEEEDGETLTSSGLEEEAGKPFKRRRVLTVYLGASFITSMRGMSEPTTPRRIPCDSWRERCQHFQTSRNLPSKSRSALIPAYLLMITDSWSSSNNHWFLILVTISLPVIDDLLRSWSGAFVFSVALESLILTHRFLFLAEDWHGHWGHQQKTLSFSGKELQRHTWSEM